MKLRSILALALGLFLLSPAISRAQTSSGTSPLSIAKGGTSAGTASAARAALGLAIGSATQAWDTDLDCIAAISSTGVIARTGSGACAVRTITGPAAGFVVTNGNGVSGNPTLALANDLAALESLSSTGFAVRIATDIWAQRTHTGTANEVCVTNGDGVSANPTYGICSGFFSTAHTYSVAQALGSSTATTQSPGDNSTKLATTAYADTIAALKASASRNILTGCGLAGGGDLSADRTIRLSLTINAQTGTTYTVLDGDCGKLISLNNASPVSVTLPQANGSTFVSGWSVDFQNKGAGAVTITPTTSTINGGSSLVLAQNQGMHCDSDGSNYTCVLGVGAGGGSGTVTNVGTGTGLAGGPITATGTLAVADGVTLQTVYAEMATYTTGTTTMSGGSDTVPQQTDGTQLVTVPITPKLSTSKLLIEIDLQASHSAGTNLWAGIFQDATAAALAARMVGIPAADSLAPVSFRFQMTSGTTSSTTFKLRIGMLNGAAGTWSVNGNSTTRRLGGAQRVTITVREIKA